MVYESDFYTTRRPYSSSRPYTSSYTVTDFDDEAREIRAKTDNLLRKIHVFVPRPVLSDYEELTIPERLRSDDYVRRIINAKHARKDIEDLPWYSTPEKRHIGAGHLACIKYAGGRPQSKRRSYYTVGDLVPGDVKTDVKLMSYYLKNRKAAEDASPIIIHHSVPASERRDAGTPTTVTWADGLVYEEEEEIAAEEPAAAPVVEKEQPPVQEAPMETEVQPAEPEPKPEKKIKKEKKQKVQENDEKKQVAESAEPELDEDGVKKTPDEDTIKRVQEYIEQKAAEKKLFNIAVAQAVADEVERVAKEDEELLRRQLEEEDEDKGVLASNGSVSDFAVAEETDVEEHSIQHDVSDQDNEAKPYEVDQDEETQVEEDEPSELENPFAEGEGSASAAQADEPVEDAPQVRTGGAAGDEGGFDWSEVDEPQVEEATAEEQAPELEEEAAASVEEERAQEEQPEETLNQSEEVDDFWAAQPAEETKLEEETSCVEEQQEDVTQAEEEEEEDERTVKEAHVEEEEVSSSQIEESRLEETQVEEAGEATAQDTDYESDAVQIQEIVDTETEEETQHAQEEEETQQEEEQEAEEVDDFWGAQDDDTPKKTARSEEDD